MIINNDGEVLAVGFIKNLSGEELNVEIDYIPEKAEGMLDGTVEITFNVLDSSNGIIVYKGKIFSYGDKYINIKDVEKLNTIQRRQDVKAYLETDITITPLSKEAMEDIEVKLKDISCGGLCIISEQELDISLIYSVVIFFTSIPIIPRFRIVRFENNGDGKYIYGCKFLKLKPGEEALIRSFVFRSQIEQRKLLEKMEEKKANENKSV